MTPDNTPEEKAIELIEKFMDHVNPYVGSGMLSNSHDESIILWQSKKCAIIAVDEILKNMKWYEGLSNEDKIYNEIEFWNSVKQEIKKL